MISVIFFIELSLSMSENKSIPINSHLSSPKNINDNILYCVYGVEPKKSFTKTGTIFFLSAKKDSKLVLSFSNNMDEESHNKL